MPLFLRGHKKRKKQKSKIMSGYNYLTQEGYTRLTAELEEMKSQGRADVAKAIAEAREKGDLSENAEYDAAKEAQGMLELKINELEKVLANARVLDESQLDISKVTVLSNVTIKNTKTGKSLTYKLVSESEADLKAKRISVKSPMGQGLLGKAIGDIAVVETPNGNLEFEILNIALS
jgi:transcription elongation factor GreA